MSHENLDQRKYEVINLFVDAKARLFSEVSDRLKSYYEDRCEEQQKTIYEIIWRKQVSNSVNQTRSFYNILDVEDLPYNTAANIQGGAAMELYRHPNLKGDRLAAFDGGGLSKMSGNADNQATSVRITAGRWRFYALPGLARFIGKSVTLGPGVYDFRSFQMDDSVSAFTRVG